MDLQFCTKVEIICHKQSDRRPDAYQFIFMVTHPGKVNPADLPTRRQTAKALIHNQLWSNGPSVFVSEDQTQEAE